MNMLSKSTKENILKRLAVSQSSFHFIKKLFGKDQYRLAFLTIKGKYRVPVEPGSAVWFMANRTWQDNRMVWKGYYYSEPYSKWIWLQLVKHAAVAVDVGANVGEYTLPALAVNPALKLQAFEPIPHNVKALGRSIALNEGFGNRCTLYDFALSNTEEKIFYHDYAYAGFELGSIFAEAKPNAAGTNFFITKTYDSLGLEKPDVIKIDVETAEELTLTGMEQTIVQHRPVMIVEILKQEVFDPLHNMIQRWGYRWLQIDDNNNKVHQVQGFVKKNGGNFLMYPPEKAKAVEAVIKAPLPYQL
jgi:FkbM family methyltransferase